MIDGDDDDLRVQTVEDLIHAPFARVAGRRIKDVLPVVHVQHGVLLFAGSVMVRQVKPHAPGARQLWYAEGVTENADRLAGRVGARARGWATLLPARDRRVIRRRA